MKPLTQQRRTFFEASQHELRSLHVDFPKKVHVGEVFDDFALSSLRYGLVVSVHEKLERRVGNVLFPFGASRGIGSVKLVVGRTACVELIYRPVLHS